MVRIQQRTSLRFCSYQRRIVQTRCLNKVPNDLQSRVTIVGAGVAGLATGAALTKVGIPVCVLEDKQELSETGTALGLWTNAFRALEVLGIADEIREHHPASTRVQISREDERVLKSFELPMCDGRPHEFRGITRHALLSTLRKQIGEEDLLLGCTVQNVQQTSNKDLARIILDDGTQLQTRVVIGADGVKSRVAESLGISGPNFNGQYAIRGLVEYNREWPISKETIQTWWGKGVRVGMYQAGRGLLYWFVCFNGPPGYRISNPADIKKEAIELVKDWKVPMIDIISSTPDENISRSSLGDSTVGSGQVTLAGDALHPMTPNFGQGGCTALEDAVTIAKILQPVWRNGDVEGALRKYERQRTSRCSIIVLRSFALGFLSQSELQLLIGARDLLAKVVSPQSSLSHAQYDVSKL